MAGGAGRPSHICPERSPDHLLRGGVARQRGHIEVIVAQRHVASATVSEDVQARDTRSASQRLRIADAAVDHIDLPGRSLTLGCWRGVRSFLRCLRDRVVAVMRNRRIRRRHFGRCRLHEDRALEQLTTLERHPVRAGSKNAGGEEKAIGTRSLQNRPGRLLAGG